jgi:hypothetical protein
MFTAKSVPNMYLFRTFSAQNYRKSRHRRRLPWRTSGRLQAVGMALPVSRTGRAAWRVWRNRSDEFKFQISWFFAGDHLLRTMAIARCEACGNPQGMKRSYLHPHTATTDARTGNPRILCAAMKCSRVALVWLTDAEQEEYRHGRRSFTVLRHYQAKVT